MFNREFKQKLSKKLKLLKCQDNNFLKSFLLTFWSVKKKCFCQCCRIERQTVQLPAWLCAGGGCSGVRLVQQSSSKHRPPAREGENSLLPVPGHYACRQWNVVVGTIATHYEQSFSFHNVSRCRLASCNHLAASLPLFSFLSFSLSLSLSLSTVGTVHWHCTQSGNPCLPLWAFVIPIVVCSISSHCSLPESAVHSDAPVVDSSTANCTVHTVSLPTRISDGGSVGSLSVTVPVQIASILTDAAASHNSSIQSVQSLALFYCFHSRSLSLGKSSTMFPLNCHWHFSCH